MSVPCNVFYLATLQQTQLSLEGPANLSGPQEWPGELTGALRPLHR